MRIHLGHHFYGAGNLGDDFMLAGFLAAMRSLAPEATFTCSVPFPLSPLQARFPAISWLPYDPVARARAIADCDVWLGLGGSPFQHALSRWFLDHLLEEAASCERARKPMFFLGVGVQSAAELDSAEVRQLAARAAGIWTRDPASAEYLAPVVRRGSLAAAADVAHLFFHQNPPPPAAPGRLTCVLNFDYQAWAGQDAFLRATEAFPARERLWLAQERRDLPGAERALYATIPPASRERWRLVIPDEPGASLGESFQRWPSGEWLVTARYHAALASAWAGSKVVIIATNAKLRAAARELAAPCLAPDASVAMVTTALTEAVPARPGRPQAALARDACAAFVRAAQNATNG